MCYAAVGLGCRDSNDSFFLHQRSMSLSSVSQFVFCILHGVQYFLHFFIQFFFLCVFYTSIAFVWFVVVCEQTQCKRILGDLTKVLHELFKAARQKQQATDVFFNTNT